MQFLHVNNMRFWFIEQDISDKKLISFSEFVVLAEN